MMRPLALIVTCCLGFAGISLSPQARSESTVLRGVTLERQAEIEKAIETAWHARQPRDEMVWSMARTPYFASEAPPTPRTTWTGYLAAYGTSVKDGLREGSTSQNRGLVSRSTTARGRSASQ